MINLVASFPHFMNNKWNMNNKWIAIVYASVTCNSIPALQDEIELPRTWICNCLLDEIVECRLRNVPDDGVLIQVLNGIQTG